MSRRFKKILSLALSFCFLFQQASFAQFAGELNIASHLAQFNSGIAHDTFRPLHLRYFSYDGAHDNFKVLLDKGDARQLDTAKAQESTRKLLSYFLIGVTLPEDVFWVNLRPDSADQIIDRSLEQTDVGMIMLEADLQLKKDIASCTSPRTPEGRQYWDRLYKKAGEIFGNDNVTIPTLTRPWIVPGEIIVRQGQGSAYVYKATLKVMLEQDYLKDSPGYNFNDARASALNGYSSQLIRELIIPKLTKEVNTSKRYASLRQVYYSLILARWFKQSFAGAGGSYASRINSGDLIGLTSSQPWSKTTYFDQYRESFTKGEYAIQEPVYTPTGQTIRRYFSGGADLTARTMAMPTAQNPLAGGAIGVFGAQVASSAIPVAGAGLLAMEGKGIDPLNTGSPVDPEVQTVPNAIVQDAAALVDSGKATLDDLAVELSGIYNAAVPQEARRGSPEVLATYKEYVGQHKVQVALVDGKIVGFVMYDFNDAKRYGTLWELMVAKGSQDRHIGTVLMDHAIAAMEQAGIIEIQFTVKNGSAGFYRKYFRHEGIQDGSDYQYDPVTHEINEGYDHLNYIDEAQQRALRAHGILPGASHMSEDELSLFRIKIRDAARAGQPVPMQELLGSLGQGAALRDALISLSRLQGAPADEDIQRIIRENDLNDAEQVAFVLAIQPGQGAGYPARAVPAGTYRVDPFNPGLEDVVHWDRIQQDVTEEVINERILPLIAGSALADDEKADLRTTIILLHKVAQEDFTRSKKENPLHHSFIVAEIVLRIALGEKLAAKDIRKLIALAILHDLGYGALEEGKGRVSSSKIKKMIKEYEAQKGGLSDADRLAKESAIKKAIQDGIDARKEHMKAGVPLAAELLARYNAQLFEADQFTPDEVSEICTLVGIHDNPGIAKTYETKEYKPYVEGSAQEYLFTDRQRLALIFREADRLWMLSYHGLVKDMIDSLQKKEVPLSVEEQFNNNRSVFSDEGRSYEAAGGSGALYGSFYADTFIRTKTGFAIYQEYCHAWERRIARERASLGETVDARFPELKKMVGRSYMRRIMAAAGDDYLSRLDALSELLKKYPQAKLYAGDLESLAGNPDNPVPEIFNCLRCLFDRNLILSLKDFTSARGALMRLLYVNPDVEVSLHVTHYYTGARSLGCVGRMLERGHIGSIDELVNLTDMFVRIIQHPQCALIWLAADRSGDRAKFNDVISAINRIERLFRLRPDASREMADSFRAGLRLRYEDKLQAVFKDGLITAEEYRGLAGNARESDRILSAMRAQGGVEGQLDDVFSRLGSEAGKDEALRSIRALDRYSLSDVTHLDEEALSAFRMKIRDAARAGQPAPVQELVGSLPRGNALQNALVSLSQFQGAPADADIQRIIKENGLNDAEQVAFVLAVQPGQGRGVVSSAERSAVEYLQAEWDVAYFNNFLRKNAFADIHSFSEMESFLDACETRIRRGLKRAQRDMDSSRAAYAVDPALSAQFPSSAESDYDHYAGWYHRLQEAQDCYSDAKSKYLRLKKEYSRYNVHLDERDLSAFRMKIRDAVKDSRPVPLAALIASLPKGSALKHALVDLRQFKQVHPISSPVEFEFQRVSDEHDLNAAERVAFALVVQPGQGGGPASREVVRFMLPDRQQPSELLGLHARATGGVLDELRRTFGDKVHISETKEYPREISGEQWTVIKTEVVAPAEIAEAVRDVLRRYYPDISAVAEPAQAAPASPGGIDFRALPMDMRPLGSFNGLDFKLPQLSRAELEQINVDSALQQLKRMVQGGIMPSGRRIQELVAACVQKGEMGSRAADLLRCLADICKLEEDTVSPSSPELKEALVIIDSRG